MCAAPMLAVPVPAMREALAEGAARAAVAPIPLQQLRVARVRGASGERIHARVLDFGGPDQSRGGDLARGGKGSEGD
jgi:hypothetical protein